MKIKTNDSHAVLTKMLLDMIASFLCASDRNCFWGSLLSIQEYANNRMPARARWPLAAISESEPAPTSIFSVRKYRMVRGYVNLGSYCWRRVRPSRFQG